jgi:methylmalonyl-CoA/ethylmalonyl-CoA epimerase
MTEVTDGIGVSRIGQIAMTVGDLPRAIAFYRDVLGLRFLFEAPPAMAFFDCGGVRLMLSLPEETGSHAGERFGAILYYAVDDIQQAAAALTARGVVFEQPPHIVARLPHGRSVDGVPARSRRPDARDHARGAASLSSQVSATRPLRPKLSCRFLWTQRKPAC